MVFAGGVESDTAGASAAGTLVAFDAKFGVGTTTMAFPPGAWNVALARGWAAPPPTTGRGAAGVGVACATGDGDSDGDAAGFCATSFAAGGACPGSRVQLSISIATSMMTVTSLRLDPGDTR
jgi:hypothetical protein